MVGNFVVAMIPDKDFSAMEFNPLVKGDIVAKYPKLKPIAAGAENRLVKYVLLMYDQMSPLRHHFPDLSKRKEFAADLAGYDLDKEDVTRLFDFRIEEDGDFVPYEELIELSIRYMKYQNSMVWSMIVSNEQAFYEYNKRVMMPVEGAKDKDILQAVEIKSKLMQSMDDIFQRLEKYKRELSGGDDKLGEVLTKRKMTTPESLAKR